MAHSWNLMAACDDCGAPAGEPCQRRRGYDASQPCTHRKLKAPEEVAEAGRAAYASDSAVPPINVPELMEAAERILRLRHDWEVAKSQLMSQWRNLKPVVDLIQQDLRVASRLERYGDDVHMAGTTLSWTFKHQDSYEWERVVAVKMQDGNWNLTDNRHDQIRATWEELKEMWALDSEHNGVIIPRVACRWTDLEKESRPALP